jgi:multiple antibiotic resistance protein
MTADYLLNAFATLFVAIDPIGLAPMFLAIAGGLPLAVQRTVAARSALVSAGVLLGFALVGAPLLEFLGISLAAFRIAGGILLFWIAFEMVFERRTARRRALVEARTADEIEAGDTSTGDDSPTGAGTGTAAATAKARQGRAAAARRAAADAAAAAEDARHAAIIPLAVPLTAGPGAISASILLAADAPGATGYIGLLAIILALVAACFGAFMAATRIERFLGETGRTVLTRLLGILLAALAVQFVAAGVQGPFTPGVGG